MEIIAMATHPRTVTNILKEIYSEVATATKICKAGPESNPAYRCIPTDPPTVS